MGSFEKLGFIGLGIMGVPMATNLLKAGYKLVVYDIDRERINNLPMQENIIAASSPKDVAENVSTIITMLPNSPHVEAVINGKNGILEGNLKPGSFIIDMSSISPGVTKKLGRQLDELGIKFLDAPVSGGQTGAINGTLTIMVGGKKDVFDEIYPIFTSLGKRIVYCGTQGSGQVVKVVNQLMSAVNLIGMSEGFVLGVKNGVDPVIMREVINNGAGRCWAVDDRMPRIMDGEFDPGFTIDLHKKDISLAIENANELNVPLYATSLVNEIFRTAQQKGIGKKDNSAIIKIYEELAGVEVRRQHEGG